MAEALKGGEGSGNFGHAGRPGLVGGSSDGGGDPAGDKLGDVIDDKGNRAEVYHVSNASDIINNHSAIAVCIHGKNKGTILASPDIYAGHSKMVNLYDKQDNVDNYVRFYVDEDIETENQGIFGDTNYAGVIGDRDKAIDNIYKAADILNSHGLDKSTPLIIDDFAFDNRISTTIKAKRKIIHAS